MGIAIDKNYSNNHNELFDLLGIKNPKLEREITWEDGTIDFWEDNNIAIGFFEKGTFISSDTQLIADDELLRTASKNKSILAFYGYDTTSTYCFDFFQKGQHIRKKWFSHSDDNIDQSENFGDLLEPEKIDDDHLETIFNLIGDILGKRFYNIGEEEKMYHYLVEYGQLPVQTDAPSDNEKKGFWKRLFG